MTKISIIVPVYNSEKFLDKLLNSILEQTYNNYEIVLVNDGSTDNSLHIIKKYICQNSKIKCVTIENSGPGIARKKGFEMSTGELLFFMDSDDFIPKKTSLEKIVQIYNKNKYDILFFDFVRKEKLEEKVIKAFSSKKIKVGMNDIKLLYNNPIVPALWNKIFIREKMESEYFYNHNNFEDYYTAYRYLNNCDNFYYINDTFYCTDRSNENSTSKKKDMVKILKTIDLLEKIYSESKFKKPIKRTMCKYYILSRRLLDKMELNNEQKKQSIKKAKELKKYFNIKEILEMKLNIKLYIKYIYYCIIDILS